MADNGCNGCTGAIVQQKASDENIINIARQKAKEQNKLIGLYRDERGRLCIATEPGTPVSRFISPHM